MRVILLSPLPPPVGGIATWTNQIISENKERSFVDLCVINSAIKYRKLTGVSILSRLFFGVIQAFEVFWMLLIKVVKFHPDVVHICSSGDYGLMRDIIYIFVLRIFRFKVVLHLHRGKLPDYDEMFIKNRLEKYIAILACWVASGVVVLNAGALKALSGYSRNIDIVANFVGSKKFSLQNKYENNTKSILFVGHVIERKGVFILLDAAILLHHQKILEKLIFVGPCDDEIKRQLLAKVPDSMGSDWIEFRGSCSPAQVESELVDCSVFCLPSYAEGLPFALLEAMAIGAPIVSTNVSGIPNVLANGAGLCVNPGSVEALAEALRSLLVDSPLAKQIGQCARIRCRERYSGEVAFQKLVDFWKKK